MANTTPKNDANDTAGAAGEKPAPTATDVVTATGACVRAVEHLPQALQMRALSAAATALGLQLVAPARAAAGGAQQSGSRPQQSNNGQRQQDRRG